MNRILTFFICLHWAAVFVALALMAGLHGGENFTAVLAAIDIQFAADADLAPPGLCALLAVGFGIVASLFLWALATGFLDAGFLDTGFSVPRTEESGVDEVAGLAFGAAVAVFTLVFLGCAAAADATGLYRSMALEIGALLVSYLAICADRRMAVAAAARAGNAAGAAARTMALHAAHETLLARLGGQGSGGRS